MKVITIKQPWASLVIESRIENLSLGIKDIENRTWPCPKKHIGERTLIHAGAKMEESALERISMIDGEVARRLWFDLNDNKFPLGEIIGSVEIVDCVINHQSIWAEKTTENCSEKCRNAKCEHFIEWGIQSSKDFRSCKLVGESNEVDNVPYDCPHRMKIDTIYNWVLANPIKFPKPIPAKGKLRFWDFDMYCPEFSHFGARYPDARCIDGYLWDMDSDENGYLTSGGDDPCPYCNPNEYMEYKKWLTDMFEQDNK